MDHNEIELLEQQKAVIQQQAAFELGKVQGRIELLKEQETKKEPEAPKPEK